MQNYTYTTDSMHFIWCCIQVRGGERGLERVKWGRRAVPLRGDQPPTYNPWWARWGLGLCRWAGGGGGTIPFKFNLCWCAACCDCHFARWRKMENSRTIIQTTRQLTWKLDWERNKLFSELDLYEVHFFFAPQGIVAWQYASRFFRRIPVKRFFPPRSEWVMTNTIDIIVEFLKRSIFPVRKQRPSPPRWISSLSYLLQAHPRPHNCEIVAQTALFPSRRGCLSLRQVLVARDASLPDRNWGPSNTLEEILWFEPFPVSKKSFSGF